MLLCLQDQLRRAAIRNQALHTDWELGPMQNGLEGRAHGLVILPRPTPRETFAPLLQDLRVQKLLKGQSDYEVLDQHGNPIDEELYDRWAIPVNDPAFKDRLEANELLMDLFDRALTLAERWCARRDPDLPLPVSGSPSAFELAYICLTLTLHSRLSLHRRYGQPGVARAWFYKLKVGSHGPLVMKPTEHDLLQGRNHLLFVGDVGDCNVQCEVQVCSAIPHYLLFIRPVLLFSSSHKLPPCLLQVAGARDSWTFPSNKSGGFICHSEQYLTITAPQVQLPQSELKSRGVDWSHNYRWQQPTLVVILLTGDRLVRLLIILATQLNSIDYPVPSHLSNVPLSQHAFPPSLYCRSTRPRRRRGVAAV